MRSATRLGLAGGVCTLVGVGMARFAYTPLIPALVEAGWFSAHDAAYIGAINLFGYLLGAATAHRVTMRLGVRTVLGLSLAVTALSFYGCAVDGGVIWYGVWRLACGVTGAMLVVVGVPAALSRVGVAERARTGALVFTGIGLGVIASATLVPWLAGLGLTITWLALGAVATALSAWAWFAVLDDLQPLRRASPGERAAGEPRGVPGWALALVIGAYGLDALGFVPHTLFWVDYIARELGRGLATGSGYWVVFGAGAMCGPIAAGVLATRFGFRAALAFALAIKAVAVALPLWATAVWALSLSSFLVGLLVPGVVTLTSGAVASLSTPERQQQFWGWATLSFALAQAIGAYGMSWAYEQWASYRPLFGVAAVALLIATACATAGALRRGP